MEEKEVPQQNDVENQEINQENPVPEQGEMPEPVDELGELKIEIAEQKDKFIRLYAEFDNFKRRNAKERIELMQTAGREVIQSMLEVMDDCDRAERQLNQSEDLDQIRKGVALVFSKLRNKLHARGLKEMSCMGEDFNPDFHEAITEIPVQDENMKGKVVDEVEKGYTLNEKIIRFSKVVVGK